MTSPAKSFISPKHPQANGKLVLQGKFSSPTFKDDTLTSSLRPNLTPNLSTIPGDFLSPVKIPESVAGVSSKHSQNNARRNTIHDPVQKLIKTPTTTDTIEYPATSPRQYATKQNKETGLHISSGEEKENKNPFQSSPHALTSTASATVAIAAAKVASARESLSEFTSPAVKSSRHSYGDSTLHPGTNSSFQNPHASSRLISSPLKRVSEGDNDRASKISKTITSANDASVPVNEIFHKEDLVAQLSNSNPLEKARTVIDIDTSDPEDYGRIDNTVSQTIIPDQKNAIGSTRRNLSSDNNTQVGKIIRSDDVKDYFTPQRPTESVARSPATNQLGRINEALNLNEEGQIVYDDADFKAELKDSTSPLKNHVRRKDGSERTIHEEIQEEVSEDAHEQIQDNASIVTLSPNSKPVYSIKHLQKIRSNDQARVEQLRQFCEKKDTTILDLNHELALLNNEVIRRKADSEKLRDAIDSHLQNQELLSIQLEHNQHEINTLSKSLRLKVNTVRSLEIKLEDETANRNKSEEILTALKQRIEELTVFNSENTDKIASLLTENKQLIKSSEEANAKLAEAMSSNENLQDINSRQEELLKELDNLENLANDKIYNLEKAVSQSKSELQTGLSSHTKEKQDFKTRINELENEILELNQTQNENEFKWSELNDELISAKNINKKLTFKIEALETEISSAKLSQDQELKELEADIQAKEQTITEYTTKLNELVEAIHENTNKYDTEVRNYKHEIDGLQQQLTHANNVSKEGAFNKELHEEEAARKINDISLYLHKEYATKHSRKMGELKDSYEKDLAAANQEKKSSQREADSLKRKLNRALEEVQKLTDIVHVQKLQYPQTSAKRSDDKAASSKEFWTS